MVYGNPVCRMGGMEEVMFWCVRTFWRMGGMAVVIFRLVCSFWYMGDMAVACKNVMSPMILSYGVAWRLRARML
jgi:hypothetical protein